MPNFDEMSFLDLRAYVLAHREDEEAIRALFSRRSPNAVKYSMPQTDEDLRQMEEIFRRKVNGEL